VRAAFRTAARVDSGMRYYRLQALSAINSQWPSATAESCRLVLDSAWRGRKPRSESGRPRSENVAAIRQFEVQVAGRTDRKIKTPD